MNAVGSSVFITKECADTLPDGIANITGAHWRTILFLEGTS